MSDLGLGMDFEEFFNSLTPDEQEQLLYEMGLSEGNAVPYSFEGSLAPSLSPQQYDMASMSPLLSDYNTKGQELPFGIDQMGQLLNQQQDRNQLLADNITAALAGPGAYDPSAFEPTYEFSGPVLQTPGQQMASYYASMGGGGYQSAIAREMLENQTDPSTAVAKVLALAQMPDSESLTPELRAQRDAIVQSLPVSQRTTSGIGQVPSQQADDKNAWASGYDLRGLYDFANTLGAELAKDPTTGGYEDPATGTRYQNAPEEKWSEAAQKYRELGLPFPTASYLDDTYTQRPDETERDMRAAQAGADLESVRSKELKPDEARSLEDAFRQYQQDKTTAMEARRPTRQPREQATGWAYINGVKQPGADLYSGPDLIPAVNDPSYFRTRDGVQIGDPKQGMAQALGAFDFGGMANAMRAQVAPEPTGDFGKVSQNPAGASRERQRRAVSRSIDARQRTSGEAQDFQGYLQRAAAALVASERGRTPLQDALMKRMMINRNQGVYG